MLHSITCVLQCVAVCCSATNCIPNIYTNSAVCCIPSLTYTRTQPEESVQKDLNWINDGFQINLPAGLKRSIAAALGIYIHTFMIAYVYICICWSVAAIDRFRGPETRMYIRMNVFIYIHIYT